MPRVVVVPATPLLVRGASGRTDALAGVRAVVRDVLVRELGDVLADAPVQVLGVGPTTRAGRLRPTLGAAGIADRQVPILAALDDAATAWDGLASTGPSVALLALADAGTDLARRPVDVVELSPEASTAEVTAVVERLRHLRDDALLVVADHPAPAVDAVVEALTAVGHWTTDVTDVPQRHEHLPPAYRVTVSRTR
ncbi:hypothetical protein [Xylanimonas protaetiae]|uniref:Uncharacterized protein n=1 Tax=Xylanimonas protaetiae TaxID=2509457 RepID=A0A4P6F713_9MICO|nr:hypothetical protein [Xylanimonas protaetiae]QAY70603.1 hypothetical protein ET471_11695 [Xylanimonas protaetiae]